MLRFRVVGFRVVGFRLLVASLVLSLAGCEPDPVVPPDGGPDAAVTCERDLDCDDGRYCNGAERCLPDAPAADPRGCAPAAAPCPAAECDESGDRCGECLVPDRDGDGVDSTACEGTDCDDSDPDRYPGHAELCDEEGHDEDCDPLTLGGRDADGDGAVAAACCNVTGSGERVCGTDCDDAVAGTSPLATEVCNATDDDCDGAVDETVILTLWEDADGDGFGTDDPAAIPTRACSESANRVIARGDCDDAAPGRNPGAPEVCNAIDEDCDGLTDDVFDGVVACVSGTSRPCATACGVDGTAACRADCLGFEACVGTEVCNGCDDDADGARDEGFACERGFPVSCTTACGTTGVQRCTAECTLESCIAGEICNYCDDDGINGIADERALAIDSNVVPVRGGGAAFGVAHEDVTAGSPMDIYVDLLDGAAVDAAGAYWIDVAPRVGWGPVRMAVELQVRTLDGGYPFGGWSIVLATGGTGDLGAARDFGVPTTLTGARFDWWWGGVSPITSFPEDSDRSGYRAMSGLGFPVRGYVRGDARGLYDVVNSDADLASGSTAPVTQRMIIEYQPENPYTSAREEEVRLTANGNTTVYRPDTSDDTSDPRNDVPVGSPLRIGLTAGSYAHTFSPGGPPITLGARIHARVRLTTFSPPVGPGAPTWVDHVTVSRAQICSE